MFECFICSQEREQTNFWKCEQCSKEICLHCYEYITNKERPRCPYCRLNIGHDERNWEFPFDIPFYDQGVIPLLPIDGDIITEFIHLPNQESQTEFDQWIRELADDSATLALNAIDALIREYLPELNNLEN